MAKKMIDGANSGRKIETTTVCYGAKKDWDSRKEAEEYFLDAMICSEGSESDRYAKIYSELLMGLPICTDTYAE